jgi:methyltransferase-like protein
MVKSKTPLAKAMLCCLGEAWPLSLQYSELEEAAAKMLANSEEIDNEERKGAHTVLLRSYLAGLIDFSLIEPSCSVDPGERPKSSSLARYEAGTDGPVTNLHNEHVQLSTFEREVLKLLDGTKTNKQLIKALKKINPPLSNENLNNEDPGKQHSVKAGKKKPPRGAINKAFELSLAKLASQALLQRAKS